MLAADVLTKDTVLDIFKYQAISSSPFLIFIQVWPNLLTLIMSSPC